MKQITRIIFGLLTVLLSCNTGKDSTTTNFSISDPRLVDFETSDTIILGAITKARDYLTVKESETDLNDFYLDSVYVKTDTVILLINHADYYVEWRMMKEAEQSEKERETKGETIGEQLYIPPTGNWSGKDRTILYLTKNDSIIDILYQ